MNKVKRHVVRKMIRDECDRVLHQYRNAPLKGLIKLLEYIKIDYEVCITGEIKIDFGAGKTLVIKEE